MEFLQVLQVIKIHKKLQEWRSWSKRYTNAGQVTCQKQKKYRLLKILTFCKLSTSYRDECRKRDKRKPPLSVASTTASEQYKLLGEKHGNKQFLAISPFDQNHRTSVKKKR